MLRAITFDCWGTLVDAFHSTKPERITFLSRYLPGMDLKRIEEAYDVSVTQFALVAEHGLNLSTATVLSLTLDFLGATLPPDDLATTLRQWEETVLYSPPPLLDGALEMLRAVRSRGLAVGLISDTGMTPGRVMRRMFFQLNLLPLFDWLTFSDQIGVTKRHVQPFASTCRALSVHPSEALHIGDLLETDIRGAHAAGMRAGLLLQNTNHREGIPEADLVLERWEELPDALASLA